MRMQTERASISSADRCNRGWPKKKPNENANDLLPANVIFFFQEKHVNYIAHSHKDHKLLQEAGSAQTKDSVQGREGRFLVALQNRKRSGVLLNHLYETSGERVQE